MTMQIDNSRWPTTVPAVLVSLLLSSLFSFTARAAELRGTVSDPLGAVIPHAQVVLLRDNTLLAHTATNDLGGFVFSSLSAGRYRVRGTAAGFPAAEGTDVYVGVGKTPPLVLSLKIRTVTKQVCVSP